jgi:fibronectin-binding autotransporter adhesin
MTDKRKPVRHDRSTRAYARRLLCGASLAAVLASALPAVARAEDRHWDANGTAVGVGGSGTWNLGNLNWSPNGDGVSGPFVEPWDNGALDTAIFGGTAGTVTVGVPVTVGNITFTSAGYVLNGGTITLGGVSSTIQTNSGTTIINSVLAGTSGLTKAGGGTLQLSGINTFSGSISLLGGSVHALTDAALGNAANNITTAAGASVTLRIDGAATARSIAIGDGGTLTVSGAGVGSALISGNGRVNVAASNNAVSIVRLTNDANSYTGATIFNGCNGVCSAYFSSIADLGQASSLGAPTTVADGTIVFNQSSQYSDSIIYIGDGHSSNRNWDINGGGAVIRNQGSGTLTLTGDIDISAGGSFNAETADISLLGVLSGGSISFNTNAGRAITLGATNTFSGQAGIGGLVRVSALADIGSASSLGVGTNIALANGILSYTGAGASSDRAWLANGANSILNDGSGALTLSGDLAFNAASPNPDSLTLGGSFAGTSVFSGNLSGAGNLISNGTGIWVLSGANTHSGSVTVNSGTLRAGSASAFGAANGFVVNGGTLDLGDIDLVAPSIGGTGGTIALGSATLTVNATTTQNYGGSITGTGGLTKAGAGTLTLTGASSYSGATTITGGRLALDFTGAGGPASDILSSSSHLVLSGGSIDVLGAAGETNSQSSDGVTVNAGSSTIRAVAGAGGTVNVNLGAINRTGGLVNFVLPSSGAITTANADGALGGWATINGSDYAKVVGGGIIAFDETDYTNKDDAGTWLTGEIISDTDGAADSPFFGTVGSDTYLGGLRYTAAADSTVTIGAGNTLGVDGTIIVAPSTLAADQTISGGNLTSGLTGGTLGVQHNGTGNFTIGSAIVDGGGVTSFAKGGGGRVILTGANGYTGSTTLTDGVLQVGSIGNGGAVSNIGASSADSSNLVLEGGTLQYTGGTATTDRGFTLVNGAPSRTIEITGGAANLTFTGLVTSPDNAGLTKTGPGTLTLANGANNYVGVTTVNGGTLAATTLSNGGAASSIGAASSDPANIVLAGGTLAYLGSTTAIDRGITLGSGGGGIGVTDAGTTLTISGLLTGTSLRKQGAGTLVLSGANTYANGTTVNQGVLRAGAVNVFGSGGMDLAAGALLDLDGFDNRVTTLTGAGNIDLGSGTLTVNSGGTFTGTISGSGGLTRAGTNQFTLFLSGCNNSYTGATSITNGTTLSVDCLADGGALSSIGASSSASSSLVFNNGVLSYTGGSVTVDRGFTLAASTGAINVANAATTLEFTGAIVGGGGLRKDGAGTLVLSGTNSSTGNARITGGTLRAGSAQALGSGALTLDNTAGVTLDLNGFANSVAFLTGGGANGGTIDLNGASLTINTGSSLAGANYAGVITGSGNLIKNGGSTQQLSGCASDYDGVTTINAGILAVTCLADGGGASSIGVSSADASSLVLNGGTLQYVGAGGSTNRRFTLGASTTSKLDASGAGTIAFTDTGPISFASPDTAQTLTLGGTNTGNNILAAQITNNGTGITRLTKTDAGTWVLTNAGSTYTGITTISGGVLAVDKLSDGGVASSIGASSAAAANLVIGNGSTLRYTGSGDTTNRLFTLSAGVTFIESSGTGAIVFTDTGPVTLAGNNQARTIALGGTNAGNNTLAGSIGNAGTGITTLAKNDSGTWVLTGNHSYTGTTNINAGTLFIGNGGTTGSIASAIVNNFGLLGFDRSDTLAYAGQINGTGSVLQAGLGNTILTGTNLYTGGTTISAGRLQLGNGGATGSIVGDVANDGILTFNRNNAYVFGGVISGSGAVEQVGAGTTTFTADHGYTGGTTISAGTLQIGNGGTTGSILGDVVDNGMLTYNRSNDLIFGGTISGTGALTKLGAGRLTLTADNSYAGGTTISQGVLQIGNGGTTGAITGDVLNNGSLVFFRSDDIGFDGLISGTGSLVKNGAGTLTLSANNSYGGATTINAGRLLINGDQSAATGLIAVSAGATLGGNGIIGGDVNVVSGGILAPGNSPGTLTINGNLLLASGSILNYELGQANVPGGSLNDLIDVGGNLRLDGIVNVDVSAGGSFGPGVYRLINYGGTLTDNGLEIGAMPGGSAAFVQTAVGGQVNLVNTAGLTLNFWDGTAGPKNDGSINGGDGIWRVDGGANNWTEVNGDVNADYAQDSFAIFQGAPGTVTVDNVGGNVLTAGMQFAVDGYRITGGPLTLTGTEAFIRVGDGGANDADYTATIDAELTGSAGLVKDLGGTLVLAGTNSYTGGTAINGGTLRISADANLGAAGGGLSFDGGTLNTTADIATTRGVTLAGNAIFDTDAGTALTLGGPVSGAGELVKDGDGTLLIADAAIYSGGTTIHAGALQIGNGGTAGSILGDVANEGDLRFFRSDDILFGGTVSGTGTLTKLGAGMLTLTADNSYTGTTSIDAGTLRLGAGGLTGGISGDVVNSGTLIFDRSNELIFAGLISGSGNVVQAGPGRTILTGTNSYAGTTTVGGGTLLINGDQGGATGDTEVLTGATLGGIGIIGGNVLLNDGATLAPGQDGPGTLTINGNLGLSAGTRLDFDFGQSDIVGGPLNDLVEVGGDLTLDGTIDVTVSAGGNFGPGLYRIISYGGTLDDQGLDIGIMPPGSLVAVQTAVAGQVNLINAAGEPLNFWDGAAGPKFDGAVNGGDGVWQSGAGNDNWADITGGFNGPYNDGGFAIFSAAPGTVTVDNSLGAVTASGMQFASDGYVIAGDDIALVAPQSIIRVGDGTAAGAGFTATIVSALTGTGDLEKTDLGTLVLTGASSFAGDVYARAGELRLSGGGTLGSANGLIGPDAGDQAIFTVTGRDGGGNASTWTIGTDLMVGYSGTGTLNIADGGKVTSSGGLIGLDDSGVGQVLVTGTGSSWENSGRINVGLFGTGTLRIEDGATVSSNDGVVGASGQGDVVVSGPGSSWTNAQQLAIGSFGIGTMRIEDGAIVTSNQGFIGANADGSVVVTGAGSTWSVTTFSMTVGNEGAGSLTIEDGGRVRAEGGFSLGSAAGSSGTVTLLGTAGNRGVLETGQIGAGLGAISFSMDGGLLRATQDVDNFFVGFDAHDLTLGANGGVIDTDGHDIGISPRFVGAGGLTKDGAGTLTLTGASSYAGATIVNAGTLIVDGDQSAATGLTTIFSGATLGGNGIIGGDVDLLDGGILAPGTSTGTLTINGNLSLSGGSILAYEFGQANVAGGPLNDLVDVGGDLILDGTINVSVPAGGIFGPGIYRVFNYGGTLTDNGLNLGTMPAGADLFVQTAVAGQVNLVNSLDVTLSFWDGAAGPKNNGAVNGGDGVWRVGGGSNNWTGADGALNADYAQDSFAIFSAAPGVVTIDHSGGDVLASGMQFASDGYVVTGDALTLTGTQAIVQVGDGSAASADYTATIAADIGGSAQLIKTDAGTLVLTGTGSYAGGTAIDGGMLQIGNGGAGGSITGDIVNNGALVVDRSGMILLDGAISGTGSLTKRGSGILELSGANSYAGGTTIGGGTVLVSSDDNLGDAAGILSLQGGTLQAGASFASGRAIRLGSPNSNGIDTQGFDVTLAGVISDGPNNSAGNFLDKRGSGTLTLTGANSYSNRTVIASGTLALAGGGTIGAGNLVVGGGTVFDISQTDTGARVTQLGGAADGTIALGSKTLTLGLGNSFTDWAGTITDGGIGGGTGGNVVITASGGAVRYFGANSYTGGTTVAAGSFELVGDGSLHSQGAVTVNGGALFNIAGIAAAGTTIGDLAGAGSIFLGDKALTFGTVNDTAFSGPISGNGGGLVKQGAGTFTLSGANSYTGTTDVLAGTLLVNGNQSAATGLTSVAAGATLGGTGTIGGDVVVADGATLAPGAGGPATLTINGNLALSGDSTLAYEFGQANNPGGPLNDLVNVGGDLILDGTLDIAVSPGGSFDIGLYRVANYGGTLTDNGLALGTMPAGADLFVQTSVANQVNLINRGSATLNFWDGAAGPKFNGAVNGGDGVWQNSSGNDNWADISGAVNAGYDDGAFAIFSGTAGTVTIDNSLGAVSASGLQFAADGYRITGDALTLDGAQAVIRVGDGTAGGAAYVATINAEVGGAAELVKTDAGTLVLEGTNSYTGGTRINGGTLRIAADASLGAASGGLGFDGGTLHTIASFVSARDVELIGSGGFLTDAGTTLTLAGTFAGTGSFTKSGGGTLVLGGSGTFGGAAVGGGTLFVNGDYSGATGTTNVLAGATLGGTGTIGGNVSLANGAILAPGAGSAGTLTIGGNLSLSATTQLDFEFGQAGSVGGGLNDLVEVGGNLTLDGVINVSVPAGGAFDIGVYRVFNYGGALTDNGLTLGALPGGSNVAVQTSIAGQVNLVNSEGLTLNFWDGAAGPKNNGAINGGNGIWQASGGNDNWTDESGAVNAAFSDGSFAIFGGSAGTVTVDDSLGDVAVSGMQFATGGYVITGDGIALTDPTATIRVGDGSTAGAGYVATIDSVLGGAAQLVKTDAGTLVLGGANSYTGGTLITGGAVRIARDVNLGAADGDVTLDGGTLETSADLSSARDIVLAGDGTILAADGTTFTFDGQFSGSGALTKAGSGTLLVTADSGGFTSGTTVAAGTLAIQGVLGGAVHVGAAGRLEGDGRVASLVNAGVVAPGRGIGALTVDGDYSGNGGVLEIEAELGGDASNADRLVVGGATSGSTRVTVVNRGGLGAQTVEGIKIIDVAGASNGVFTLEGDYLFDGEQAVIAGAYGYRLYKNGIATPQDGDWYLRSSLLNPAEPENPGPLYQPGVPVYEAYVGALQSLNRLPTLQQRIGNRSWAGTPTAAGTGLWGRFESERHRPETIFSTSGADRKVDSWQAQIGIDRVLGERSDGAALVGGLTAHYGKADTGVTSVFGNGSIDTQGYGVGATLTWYGPRGFYVDGQAKLSWFDSDLESSVLGTLVEGNKGDGQAFGLDVGKRSQIGRNLTVTPQIQMSYARVDFDRFADPAEAAVSAGQGESLKTRWGLSIDHQTSWQGKSGDTRRTHLYSVMNLSYEWLDGAVTDVSGTPIANRDRRLWGELGLGGSYSWGADRFALYAEVAGETAVADFGDSYSLKGTAGFRVRF